MKKVLSIKINGKFSQYLKLSEAKYIAKICEGCNDVTVKLVEISKLEYSIYFN